MKQGKAYIGDEISEGNKLIAEFMGRSFENLGIRVAKYHSSWDWLLPAVKKFKDYLQNLERPSRNHCCKGDMLEVDLQCYLWEIDIDKVFKALITCIEWYNQNKQS